MRPLAGAKSAVYDCLVVVVVVVARVLMTCRRVSAVSWSTCPWHSTSSLECPLAARGRSSSTSPLSRTTSGDEGFPSTSTSPASPQVGPSINCAFSGAAEYCYERVCLSVYLLLCTVCAVDRCMSVFGGRYIVSVCNQPTRSTQPCITLGSLNRVAALQG